MTTYGELARVFWRIGIHSFGGPAAQIAVMHRELVEDRGWLDEAQFLSSLSFCMLLPGPEAMQLATYAGWRLKGWQGGLIGGGLFVLPGAAVMAALALAYLAWGSLPVVEGLFLGIQAAVLAIVLQALIRLGRKALGAADRRVLAGLAFLAIFAFGLPFPLIVAGAAAWGALASPGEHRPSPPAAGARTLRTVAIWGGLWAAPVLLAWAMGWSFLWQIALFFSKLAVVTFGGAYAVLAYMAQEVVQDHGWITAAQMMDGFGLAETTPGPLILVTQFVAMLAGGNLGGWGLAAAAGAMALWVTFVPCFLWIFAGAPFLEWISGRPRIAGALGAITAAVVGVILNLSVWFAIHVLFDATLTWQAGPVSVLLPDPAGLRPLAVALAFLAGFLMLVRNVPIGPVLAISAAIAASAQMLT
ncbi:chromate efflux transporter [Mangrovicoccus algicola]|uniref:Chromate efflux transporter n=1 Tax=Mangrovicoccus algicola TaxID=2771008 RepID=A0A8J7D075_9RHOB|nr:chromate efflux transporter [Mangrovicoccus algicola]MBE3639058.1 chromate efflux transporter [Mangrovicoccus algicola]